MRATTAWRWVRGLLAGIAVASAGGCAAAEPLEAFRSDAELRAFLKAHAPRPGRGGASHEVADIVVTASVPSITNNQEAGVDEGGIVKAVGDFLVVLRRGRLFTISLAGGAMRPLHAIDAFPPGLNGDDAWYDEMLVAGDVVAVLGYSYEHGTELNRFRLGPDGRLVFLDTHHLKSGDYYSSRNYASRLIGETLVFYAPLSLWWLKEPLDALPTLRRWGADGAGPEQRIARANQIFIAPQVRRAPGDAVEALHTVTTCALTAPRLTCEAAGIIGPESRSFYVSGQAVYVWVSRDMRRAWSDSAIYRLPFRGRPGMVEAHGAPIDQFSFREDTEAGRLDVLVQAQGGDAMWRPEFRAGAVALMQTPLSGFGRGGPAPTYRILPKPEPEHATLRNRFAARYLLYGVQGAWDAPAAPGLLFAAPLDGGEVRRIPLPRAVDRIETLGVDALVVGEGEDDLAFSVIELTEAPRAGAPFIHANAAQGESRSHGFFFRPDPGSAEGRTGAVGPARAQAGSRGLSRTLRKLGVDGLPAAARTFAAPGWRVGRGARGNRRRRLQSLLRRLVRQCPPDLPERADLRAAGLRTGRGARGGRTDRGDRTGELRPGREEVALRPPRAFRAAAPPPPRRSPPPPFA